MGQAVFWLSVRPALLRPNLGFGSPELVSSRCSLLSKEIVTSHEPISQCLGCDLQKGVKPLDRIGQDRSVGGRSRTCISLSIGIFAVSCRHSAKLLKYWLFQSLLCQSTAENRHS